MLTYLVVLLTATVLAATVQLLNRTLAASSRKRTPSLSRQSVPGHADLMLAEGRDIRAPRARADGLRWSIVDFALLALLVTFAAARLNVGTDFRMYLNLFDRLSVPSWREELAASSQELGYTSLSLAVKSITDSPYAIFWLSSALTVSLIYVSLRRRSRNLVLAIFLYITLGYYVMPFNLVRQGIAVAILFYADRFVSKNSLRFVVLSALAATFHASAVLAAVLQFVAARFKPRVVHIFVTVVAGALLMAAISRFSFISNLLVLLNPRYESYLSEDVAGLGTYLLIISKMALILYSIYLGGGGQDSDKYRAYLLVGLGFMVAGTSSVTLGRMEMYFGIYAVLLLPNQLQDAKGKVAHIVAFAVLALIFFLFYLASFGDLLPYRSYL